MWLEVLQRRSRLLLGLQRIRFSRSPVSISLGRMLLVDLHMSGLILLCNLRHGSSREDSSSSSESVEALSTMPAFAFCAEAIATFLEGSAKCHHEAGLGGDAGLLRGAVCMATFDLLLEEGSIVL